MRELLLRLADQGKTLIVTSHILPELSRICNVVAIVTKGKLRAFGKLQEIMRQINQRRMFEIQLLDAGKLDHVRQLVSDALELEDRASVAVSEAEAMVRFDTESTDEQLARLLAHLIDQGVSVAQFREIPTDLEDAFLTVTRRDQQEADATAPAEKVSTPCIR
jgi:ABC-2 type transport system ATP-binding protein